MQWASERITNRHKVSVWRLSILTNVKKLKVLAIGGLSAAAILALAAPQAKAGPVPSGWSCSGNCGTDGADGVVALSPSGNASYEYISTNGGGVGVGGISSVGGTNGSLLSTPVFTANAGDPLKFFFNFVTSDGAGFTDYAWAALYKSDNTLVDYMFTARTQPSGDTSPGFGLPANGATLIPATSGIIGGGPSWSVLGGSSGGCYSAGCGYTGWIQSQYEIAASGDYYLSFGTINWLDQAFDTGLAIDNVTIKNVEVPQDTPEPATMALVAAGLAGLGVVRRRRRAA